jgi:hypothetical protein
MNKKVFFNRKKVLLALLFFIVYNAISIWLIYYPERFVRNFVIKKEYVQFFGVLSFIFSLTMAYTFVVLVFRRGEALEISDDYLIDNSRFESVGKVYFTEISKVKRKDKNIIEIILKEPVFKSKKLNYIQKIVCILTNWNYKYSIIISSALLDCDIEGLEKDILVAMNWKNKKGM